MRVVPLLATLAILVQPSIALAADQGNLLVNISGLRNDKAVVRVAVFNSEAAYKADKKNNDAGAAVKKATGPIKDGHATVEFKDLAFGDYGVKFYHDEDNSGKFLTGMFGIPKVEYGFSNNAKAMMGRPPYDHIKFELKKPETRLDLSVQH